MLLIIPIYCFGYKPIEKDSIDFQFSMNYSKLGDIDMDGILIKNALNIELKNSKLSLNLSFGGGQRLEKDQFYLEQNGKKYSDYLDQQSSLYLSALYSIRPINSSHLTLYFGGGPSFGYYSTNYYQFWYKENDVDPYILLMGEYQNGLSFGYAINMQIYVKSIQRFPFFVNAGFDSFFKYQSSIFYIGLGVVIK